MLGDPLPVPERGGDLRGVGQPELALGPLVERFAAEPDHAGGAGPRRQLDPVAGPDVGGRDAGGLHGQPAAAPQDLQGQLVADRDDQPAVVRRVRRDRRDHQAFQGRADDRAAGREAVRGRAGRRGDDDRVGRVTDERVPRGAHRDLGRLVAGKPDAHDVVERGDGPVPDDRVDRQPGFGGEVVAVDRGQRGGQVGHVHLGQEAQLAQVHPEHREPLPVGQPHGPQHGAVAAHADQQVGPLLQLLRGHRIGAAGQPGQLAVDAEDLDPALIGPVQHRGHRPAAVPFRMQHQPHDVHALTLLGPRLPFLAERSVVPAPGRGTSMRLHQNWRTEDGVRLPMALWHPGPGYRMISTGVLGGGLGPREWVLNAQVPAAYARTDPAGHLRELARGLGLTGPGIGLLTAAQVTDLVQRQDEGVHAAATVGLRVPTWAAAPPGRPDPELAGTINLIVALPVPLTDAALVNAVATATEAKVQAVLDAGFAGTGTATDAICVAVPIHIQDREEEFAGPRSVWGARIARAVHAAVQAGAAGYAATLNGRTQ